MSAGARWRATEAARALLVHPDTALVAIDLRGTLLRTPRVTTLLPELDRQRVPTALARLVQSRFDERLHGPLQKRGDILDWTTYAATSMAEMLTSAAPISFDVGAAVASFRARYLSEARPLIAPESLRQLATLLEGRCTIVADGPLEREAAVLAAVFGHPAWMPPIVSSECLGVNKLTSEFFVRLGIKQGVDPTATVVVGDRWDKDVVIPGRVGCKGVLVGVDDRADHPSAGSLADLISRFEEQEWRCAA